MKTTKTMNNLESNKAFFSERFTELMKADLIVNKGNYIKLAIAAIGVFAALAFLISINAVIEINSLKHLAELSGTDLVESIESKKSINGAMYMAISIWIISIGLTVLGSLTFSNFSTKRQRISALMIPASRIEKFSLRLLLYLVGGCVLLIIGYFIGLGICQIAFGGGGKVFSDIVIFIDAEHSGSIIAAFVLSAPLGNSLYALGSSLWPKLSWIKTWVVIMVVQWVAVLILIMISTANIHWYSFFTFCVENIGFFKWTGLITLSVLNIACWVLAWWRYKNTQIIQRFMTK